MAIAEEILKDVFNKALQCDLDLCFVEAQQLYQHGISVFQSIANKTTNPTKQKEYTERITAYNNRANAIKEVVKKMLTRGKLICNFTIEDGSTGHSYDKLFGQYLQSTVKEVVIEEPNMIDEGHFQNLVAFLELVVKKCINIRFVHITTVLDTKAPKKQAEMFDRIKEDLKPRHITVNIKYDDLCYDHKIILSNGFIIKSGRGLHYFQPITDDCTLGQMDFEFRKCLNTDVDIWCCEGASKSR